MSGEFGIALALLTLGSCFASYQIGRWEEKTRWQKMTRRQRERQARWQEFEGDEE